MPSFSRLVTITWIAFLLPAIWAIEFDLGGAGQPKIIRLNIILKTDPAKRHETETANNRTAVGGQRTTIKHIGPHHHLENPKIPDETFYRQYLGPIKPSTQRPFLFPGPRPIWPTKNPDLSRPMPDEAFYRQYSGTIKPSTQRPFLFPGPRPIWQTKKPRQSFPGLETGNEHEQQRSAVLSQNVIDTVQNDQPFFKPDEMTDNFNEQRSAALTPNENLPDYQQNEQRSFPIPYDLTNELPEDFNEQRSALPENDNLQYYQNEQQPAEVNKRADELQEQPQNEQQAAVFSQNGQEPQMDELKNSQK
ncbi:hypothetical protein niasHS_011682 [Heterodera schachtii]|uniref:Uncharacterized protein n=1 Tax=Heterodera schachtii TaxID=97005 RepID=A0ABD2J590_HETSC